MAEPLQPIQTIRYKTYVKESLREALMAVFVSHADALLRDTKVTIDFPFDEASYPAVVVRFYERTIRNAGIGHDEFFEDENDPGRFIRYKHYLYDGDIEFAIYALSSYDRDLISDSLVQTLAMADVETYTNNFLARIYSPDATSKPASINHMINLNTDTVSGFGETQAQAPWGPEDQMIYQSAYRVSVFGEFYSRTPEPFNYGLINEVDVFPYVPAVGYTPPTTAKTTTDSIPFTGDASLDLFTTTTTDGTPRQHGYKRGDKVRFSGLTGGAGITPDVDYYVIASGLTTVSFKVSAAAPFVFTPGVGFTPGADGAVLNFTTNVTQGWVRRFAGTRFPEGADTAGVFTDPSWPGPDHVYGTGDDQVDPAPWEGS